MNRFFVYLIYNLLLPFVLILGFPRFILKGIQRGGLARNFRQRFGIYRPDVREKLKQPGNLWIHAVSVGEVLIALKVIRELLRKDPGCRIVLSTTTTTGFRLAEEETAGDRERISVIHNPVDLPWITWSALKLINPRALILVEAEVWPNLVLQARRRSIPVILVNGRLSDRSEKRYHTFGALTRPIFSQLNRVGVPFQGDIDRWAGLGIPRENIHLTGSVKFDETRDDRPDEQIRELRAWLTEQGCPEAGPILLAGSTHAGEEALIGHAYLQVRKQFPRLAYVVVPRHAERAGAIADDLRATGLNPILKNPLKTTESTANGEHSSPDEIPVWVANTTGELRAWYYLADVVVVGKSLLGRGGQNPVEPIVAGKPTIVGPHMQNFRAIVEDLVAAGGIDRIAGEGALAPAISGLLADSEAAAQLAKNGAAALARHEGAATRTADLVLAGDISPGQEKTPKNLT